jgi:hypothetical protein
MKNILWAIFLLCSCSAFSQTTAPVKDTLIWKDGTKYSGAILKEGGDVIKFITEDGVTHNIATSDVAVLKHANSSLDDKLPPADKKKTSAKTQSETDRSDEPGINWSDPGIPHKIVVKHNTGIGLTVVGTVFIVAGIGLIAGGAAANGQTSTYTGNGTAQASVNVGATGVVGVVMTIAGLPMMICGAVKLGKSKKLARASMIHFSSWLASPPNHT